MSILIKGMEIPEGRKLIKCFIVPYRTGYQLIVEHYDSKSDTYELAEVPTPHGRLIDGDALLAAFEKDISKQTKHMELFKFVGDMHNYYNIVKVQIGMISCRKVLDNAQTIIEAEVE